MCDLTLFNLLLTIHNATPNCVASLSQSRHFHVTIASLPRHNQRRFFVTTVCRLLPPTLTITSTNTRQLLLSTTGFTLTELNFLQQFYSPLRAFSRVEQQLTSFPYRSHLVDCFCAECHLSHGYFHLLYLSLLLNRPSLLHPRLAHL